MRKLRFGGTRGFTFVEMAATMGMASMAIIGFATLWIGFANAQDTSYAERVVDRYGNFVMQQIVADMRNSMKYDFIAARGGVSAIDMTVAEYDGFRVDTVHVRWIPQRDGDFIRYYTRGASTTNKSMKRQFVHNGNVDRFITVNKYIAGHMYLTNFRITPAGRLSNRGEDYAKLDSTALQVNMSVQFLKTPLVKTVNQGEENSIDKQSRRVFSWQTMVYLRNNHIYRNNLLEAAAN